MEKVLTQSVAFRKIRELGLSVRKTEYGEYRVAKPGRGNEATAYYTTDLEDALDTAKMMDK